MPGGTKRRGKSISPSPRDLGALERCEGRKSLPIHSGSPSIFTRSGRGPVQSLIPHPGGDFSSTFGSAYAHARGVRSAGRHPLSVGCLQRPTAASHPPNTLQPREFRHFTTEKSTRNIQVNSPGKTHSVSRIHLPASSSRRLLWPIRFHRFCCFKWGVPKHPQTPSQKNRCTFPGAYRIEGS